MARRRWLAGKAEGWRTMGGRHFAWRARPFTAAGGTRRAAGLGFAAAVTRLAALLPAGCRMRRGAPTFSSYLPPYLLSTCKLYRARFTPPASCLWYCRHACRRAGATGSLRRAGCGAAAARHRISTGAWPRSHHARKTCAAPLPKHCWRIWHIKLDGMPSPTACCTFPHFARMLLSS